MADPAAKRRATYQDVLDAPEHLVAEIVGGELRLSPRPGAPATAVASNLGAELIPPFSRGRGGPGGWIVLDEPELHLGEEILIPDLAGWKLDRLPVVPAGAAFTVTPNWVCEVASPSSVYTDRYDKLPIYAAAGVEHAWLVNPTYRTIEAFRLHDGKWLAVASHAGNTTARIEPFEAAELDLSVLWANIPLPTKASEEAMYYGR